MRKILIVDEDEWYFFPVTLALEDEYSFEIATTVSEGYNKFQSEDYHLLILDLWLPIGPNIEHDSERYPYEGMQLFHIIKKEHPDFPIICFTHIREDSVLEWQQKNNVPLVFKVYTDSVEQLIEKISEYSDE